MPLVSSAPAIGTLAVPKDAWTAPFWDATEREILSFPQCRSCGRFRWPPGPFCPACQSQAVDWIAVDGPARLYSFTIVHEADRAFVPALVEFDGIEDVRLLTAIVDTPLDAIRAGAVLALRWSSALDARVPVFRIAGDNRPAS